MAPKPAYFELHPTAIELVIRQSGAVFQAHVVASHVPPLVVDAPAYLHELFSFQGRMPSFRVLETFYGIHEFVTLLFSPDGRVGLEMHVPEPTAAEKEARTALAQDLADLQQHRATTAKALPLDYLAHLQHWERFTYDCQRLLAKARLYVLAKKEGPPLMAMVNIAARNVLPDGDFEFKYKSHAVFFPTCKADDAQQAKYEAMCVAFAKLQDGYVDVPQDGIQPQPTPAPDEM